MLCQWSSAPGNFSRMLTAVYGPNVWDEIAFWNEIRIISNSFVINGLFLEISTQH